MTFKIHNTTKASNVVTSNTSNTYEMAVMSRLMIKYSHFVTEIESYYSNLTKDVSDDIKITNKLFINSIHSHSTSSQKWVRNSYNELTTIITKSFKKAGISTDKVLGDLKQTYYLFTYYNASSKPGWNYPDLHYALNATVEYNYDTYNK